MTDAAPRVLVVDDEIDLAESCRFFLRRAGYEADVVHSGEDALRLLEQNHYGLVISDIRMPRMSGLKLLDEIMARDRDIEVVLVTGFPDVATAVDAMKRGAFDYVTKPFDETALMERVEKALRRRDLKDHNRGFRDRQRKGPAGRRVIVSASPVFGETVELVERAGRTDASVLLEGESGTGKELLAHRLHDASARAGKPFVPVDCTTIAENLFESELFGHVKGAFSGASADRVGLFEVADGGTLFLDEVGELPLAFQSKLLRAIQERQIRRVGDTAWRKVDVRIVCATNRRLAELVERGGFREDLFYRLDVVRIDVPPLRDRPEDIEPLAHAFLEEFVAQNPVCSVRSFAPDALEALLAFHWPGNVRQLRNAVERAATLGEGERVLLADLPRDVRAGAPTQIAGAGDTAAGDEGRGPVDEAEETFQEMKARKVAAIENSYLTTLLRRHGGNVTRCAEEAGMSRQAFQKLMQRYQIRSSDYREE
jgi:DNA-binding NtrC family response regulator